MLIPSLLDDHPVVFASLSRRVNANSQPCVMSIILMFKLIKKGEC